jgi:AcrR family transcriptional regulator
MSATALQLLLTAERLFAKHGFAGVSLRQICAEAGSGNNSAVSYHFGSKEGLVDAIFAYRLPQLIQRRSLLEARLHPGDLRTRVEAHLLPVLELAEAPDSHYLSFLEQLERSAASRALLTAREASRSQAEFVADIQALLPDIDEPVRKMRISQMQMLSLHAAAERERDVAAGTPVMPFGLFVSTLIDACTGYLIAPVSEETKRFLRHLDDAVATTPMRLV